MSLIDLFRQRRPAPPAPPDETDLHRRLDEALADLAAARDAIITLRGQINRQARQVDRVTARAADAETQLAQLLLVAGQHPYDEMLRMRRALTDAEEQLAVCRSRHGWNTRPDRPHPLVHCAFCGDPVADLLAPCDRVACQDLEASLVARQRMVSDR